MCICVNCSVLSNSLWPHDCNSPGSWKWKVKVKSLSHVQLFVTPWTVALQAPQYMGFSRHEYWSGLLFPSPGDLPDPGIEPGLSYCRWTLYRLSYQGSSVHVIPQIRILDWDAMPYSRRSFQSRDWTQVCCIAGRSFTIWANREALDLNFYWIIRMMMMGASLIVQLVENLPAM